MSPDRSQLAEMLEVLQIDYCHVELINRLKLRPIELHELVQLSIY